MTSRLWQSASRAAFGPSSSEKGTDLSGTTAGGKNPTTSTPAITSKPLTDAESPSSVSSWSSYLTFSSPYWNTSSYWDYANESINYASESTYLTLASILSPFYAGDSLFGSANTAGGSTPSSSSALTSPYPDPSSSSSSSPNKYSSFLLRMADRSPVRSHNKQHNLTTGAAAAGTLPPPPRVSWNVLTKNPYHSVRGRNTVHHKRESLSAVRSFLALVPLDEDEEEERGDGEHETPAEWMEPSDVVDEEAAAQAGVEATTDDWMSPVHQQRSPSFMSHHSSGNNHSSSQRHPRAGRDETASQVAEGTLRALRDLALEEALELNTALRFWSNRWERPILSWLEAGPMVWTSPVGYRHRLVGERVAQLQAVLARRCAAIGELQEHLLRAGWQQGVAQWGVLDQFQTVSGVDGSIPDENSHLLNCPNLSLSNPPMSLQKETRPPLTKASVHASRQSMSESQRSVSRQGLKRSSSHIGAGNREDSSAHVLVRKGDGEGLYTDQPTFVAEWAVQAIALVRRHLYRAANGTIELPYESNWPSPGGDEQGSSLPAWVAEVRPSVASSMDEDEDQLQDENAAPVRVSDLNLMMSEVSALVNVMEGVMILQRKRRLDRMRAPSWIRRNWYMMVTVGPATVWLLYKGITKHIVSRAVAHIRSFVKERLTEPLMAIVNEVWKGRGNFSDQNAKIETTRALKQMIKNWLDETYPKMKETERLALSEAMDMSLIEKKKAESMKTFFEINNVVRMSFIEMQYMKREMMNALAAMDEVMSANDINMNLAAITPALFFVYASSRLVKFLYHAVLKLGRSKEETHADFRTILTDIERLMVMRDSPPDVYPSGTTSITVLTSDDLGMLMLLIHELRMILVRERRRFTSDEIRGLSEDLAELAGERGAVSVRQQLQILTRMSRTYSFLKVLSSGHMFHSSSWR